MDRRALFFPGFVLVLGLSALSACSSGQSNAPSGDASFDGSGGALGGGTGGSGGAVGGSAGQASGGTGGVPADAGCTDFTACANCLTTACATELKACDAVPACLSAQFLHADCIEKCQEPSASCWTALEADGGDAAATLRSCAQKSCPACGA